MPSKNQILGIPSPQEVVDRDTAPAMDTLELQEDQPENVQKEEGKLPILAAEQEAEK